MEEPNIQRRRQFCGRCGQLMFQFFRSPDGHFGMVDSFHQTNSRRDTQELSCSTCGARYRLLEQLNSMGQPIERR
jgi:hypothetical protein